MSEIYDTDHDHETERMVGKHRHHETERMVGKCRIFQTLQRHHENTDHDHERHERPTEFSDHRHHERTPKTTENDHENTTKARYIDNTIILYYFLSTIKGNKRND